MNEVHLEIKKERQNKKRPPKLIQTNKMARKKWTWIVYETTQVVPCVAIAYLYVTNSSTSGIAQPIISILQLSILEQFPHCQVNLITGSSYTHIPSFNKINDIDQHKQQLPGEGRELACVPKLN